MILIQLAVFHFLRNRKLSQVFNDKRFVDHDTSVEDYVESFENTNAKEKTKRDVKLLETFFRNEKSDERELQNIARRIKQAPCRLYSFCETQRRRGLRDFKFKISLSLEIIF